MDGVTFTPGERITHPEFGVGVVIDAPRDGYLRAFFSIGERRVPFGNIQRELSRTERILRSVEGTARACTFGLAILRSPCTSGDGKRVGADFGAD